ncbi:MAG TPA: hypothetical protein PKE61_10865, partial [Burkholderiaceae bacterium]|nr:hypothetical protein [Burkholderiaceae bacterium]
MRPRSPSPIGPAPALCLAAGLLLPWHATEAGWWRAATWAAWPGEGAQPHEDVGHEVGLVGEKLRVAPEVRGHDLEARADHPAL